MPKIRISAVARKPVDTAGLVSVLVELSKKLRKQPSVTSAEKSERKEARQ